MNQKNTATFLAILAAALYAINIPLSKLLLQQVQPTMMAALLYLSAGFGLFLWGLLTKEKAQSEPLTRKELPYTLGMILLDIAAPVLLMLGLSCTDSSNASLLNNFEIVATSLIAFFCFGELLSRRLTVAIGLVTVASIILGFEGMDSFQFNIGSILVLGAACCWGLENNCTRMLSSKSSVQITTIKGIFSGFGSLIVAFVIGEPLPDIPLIFLVLLLGFVSYGLSINFYVKAQKDLGAAKTSAYYSVAPFLGVAFGMILLGERPALQFYLGLVIMLAATVLMVRDTIGLQHTHAHAHTYPYPNVHTHSHVHTSDENNHDHLHKADVE